MLNKLKDLRVSAPIGIIILLLLVMFITSAVVSVRPNIESFDRVGLVKFDKDIDVIGYRTIYTMERLIEILLDKPGGFISNDKIPPFVFLDDMPSWEIGALSVLRESSIIIRRHLTRSAGAQAIEDKDAVSAQTHLHIDTTSWMFPSVEGWNFLIWSTTGEYTKARDDYRSLRMRLTDDDLMDGNFYSRATSLADAVDAYNRLLGSLSQRLSASVGRAMISSTAGDRNAREAKLTVVNDTPTSDSDTTRTKNSPEAKDIDEDRRTPMIMTDWLELDNIFWEALGAAWALEEMFDAIEYDFYEVLKDKNAVVTITQIREELKRAQEVVLSPLTLNGEGYGFVANHSLILANYLSRASATMIDLKRLIENG